MKITPNTTGVFTGLGRAGHIAMVAGREIEVAKETAEALIAAGVADVAGKKPKAGKRITAAPENKSTNDEAPADASEDDATDSSDEK